MNDNVMITITRGQAKFLVKLLDAFQVAFRSETPMYINAIRGKVWDALYPAERR